MMKNILCISLILTAILFTGCVKTNIVEPTLQTKVENDTKIFKSKVLAKVVTDSSPKHPLPYIQKSKYIKILILPFKNSEDDIDYGGILETKLQNSKFIFDDDLKKKIIKRNNSIGSI